jgi:hypothetical protein
MIPPAKREYKDTHRLQPTDQKFQPELELEHADTDSVDRFKCFADLACDRTGGSASSLPLVNDQVTRAEQCARALSNLNIYTALDSSA